MKGVGMTMEGSENNPVMFELLCELPWRPARFDKDEWLKNYTVARYGKADKAVQDAWLLLSNTIYNCPAKNTQQGTHESVSADVRITMFIRCPAGARWNLIINRKILSVRQA